MGVGPKIKELRNKAGLTQKDLADQLHVTYQAVSRWENDDAEPSIGTLKEMCGILNCSIEELLETDKKNEQNPVEEKVTVVEKVIVQEPKPVLGVCEQCNEPIFEASNLNRIDEPILVQTNRTSHYESRQRILCNSCNEIRIAAEKKIEEQRQREKAAGFRKRRIHSFIWPSLVALIFIIVGISTLVEGDNSTGFVCLGMGVLKFFLIMIL